MSSFLNENFKNLVPYTPGEQLNDKSYIKLNTNESPFAPSPLVSKAINESLINSLNLYSDPTLSHLTKALSDYYGYDSSNFFVGNGSDDILAFAIFGFCGKGGSFSCPDITYSFYPVYANLFGVKINEIPLNSDFTVNVEDYIGLNDNIIIANPNAPTGLALTTDEIEKIVKSNPDNIVIIDEAYADFNSESCIGLVEKYNNICVCRTFSKSRSLAGLRVGYSIASSEIIADLNKIKFSFNPYNVNTLSINAAAASISDRDYFEKTVEKIVNTRERVKTELIALGFNCLNSKANFVFAEHSEISGAELYQKLKENGILIRYFNKDRINNFVRITIGSDEQMDKLIVQIKKLLKV